jgi:hypothetical protein
MAMAVAIQWQWQWQCNGSCSSIPCPEPAQRLHAVATKKQNLQCRTASVQRVDGRMHRRTRSRAGQQDRQGTSACCSCAVHTLLFAHRNSRLALGMNAAFDCLCAVSNIGVQLFRWPPFPTVAVPAAVGIVVAVVAVHVAVHVQRASVGSSSSEDHGERVSSSSGWTSPPRYTDQVSPNSFWY